MYCESVATQNPVMNITASGDKQGRVGDPRCKSLALRYNSGGGANMKLNTLALAFASAILWGLCMLAMTLANLVSGSYGQQFLQLMSSVYPGYHATRSSGEV